MKLISILSIILLCSCQNLTSSKDNLNQNLLAGFMIARMQQNTNSTSIPAVVDCSVTTAQGGTATRKVFTAVNVSQEIFTSSSGTDSSTTVYVKVVANAGSKLLVNNFDKIGTGSRVITPYRVSSCPFNTSDSTIAVSTNDFTDTGTTSNNIPRTISFLVAGTYHLQFYTGSGSTTSGAPAPLSSTANRPTIQLE